MSNASVRIRVQSVALTLLMIGSVFASVPLAGANTNGGSGGPGPTSMETFEPSSSSDKIHVWKRTAYPLRSDNTDAATKLVPPDTEGKRGTDVKSLTFSRGSYSQNPTGVFNPGTTISFDFKEGRANAGLDLPSSSYDVRYIRAKITNTDSTGLPGTFKDAADLLAETPNDNAEFADVGTLDDYNGAGGSFSFTDSPSAVGPYVYYAVLEPDNSGRISVDGSGHVTVSDKITILGTTAISVQETTPSVSVPSSVEPGDTISFDVSSQPHGSDATHIAALYDKDKVEDSNQQIEITDGSLGPNFDLEEDATFRHEFSEMVGVADVEDGITFNGNDLSDGELSRSVGIGSTIDFIASDLGTSSPSVESGFNGESKTLHASVDAITASGDSSPTIDVETTSEFAEGTYQWVYIAKESSSDTRYSSKAGTITIEEQTTTSSGGGGGGGTTTTTDTTPPTADAGSDREVTVGSEVTFDGSGSSDNIGISSYDWTFPDGSSKSGETVTETFDSTGSYTVDLTVTDGEGNSDTDSVTITVEDETAAAIETSDTLVGLNTTVSFDATGSTGSIESYEWSFPDTDTTATGESVEHTFTTTGTYTVTLTVTDDDGVVSTATVDITVSDKTPPSFELDLPDTVREDSSVTFNVSNATDNVGVSEIAWELGDGTTATGESVTHTYGDPGSYTVTVTVSDDANLSVTQDQVVTVNGPEPTTSPTSHNFTEVGVTSTSTTGVEITNDGNVPLDLGNASITGSTPDQFSLSRDVSNLPTVYQGTTESLQIQYTPTDVGTHSATLTVPTNDTDSPNITVSVSGTGAGTSLRVDDSDLRFNQTDIGESATKTVTLTNRDPDAVSVEATVGGSNPDAYEIEGSQQVTIESGENLTKTVRFSPTEIGNTSANLDLQPDGDATSVTVSLLGTGRGPRATLSDSVTFGAVKKGNAGNGTAKLSNTGTAPLNVTNLSIAGSDADNFGVADPATLPTLSPGGSTAFNVSFTPQQSRAYDGRLIIGTNDTEGTAAANLTGQGLAPKIGVNISALKFGNVSLNTTQTERFTITNPESSPMDLTVSETVVLGEDTETFSVSEGNASAESYELAPGEQERISVDINPTTPGSKAGQLRLLSNAQNNPQVDIWLTNTNTVVDMDVNASNGTQSVNASIENVTANETVTLNTSALTTTEGPQPDTSGGSDDGGDADESGDDGSTADSVSVTSVSVQTTTNTDFSMNMSTQAEADEETPEFTNASTRGTEPLEYINVSHSVPNSEIAEASMTTKIDKETIEEMETTDPEDVSLYRYNDGEWGEQPTQIERETDDAVVYNVSADGFSEWTVGAKQAQFEVINAGVNVSKVRTGDGARIDVRISNTGGADGEFDTELLLNGEVVESRAIEISAGGASQVSFERSFDQSGEYNLRVNDFPVGNVTVESVATETGPGTAASDADGTDGSDSGGASPGPLALVLVVVVLIAIAVVAVRARDQS